ncbi:hypothetical protein C1645_748894 [Glomus cerebriforme]|uniref:Uncharacterized protein n=1 Tax=Glomus cerebriforme TaxID=658196 RepID=A0A397TUU1_9GLOM|nr:hypothetical protein C1645_748894 [Glomus cerebriforme]
MKFAFAAVCMLALVSIANADAVEGAVKTLEASGICKDDGLFPANGTQIRKQKTCVSLQIGEIPTADNMVSAIIIEPRNNQRIPSNQPFFVRTKISNLDTGFFSDPTIDYYQIPQTLNDNGQIQGHSHITIQKIDGKSVPDPTVFAFFKGLNDKADNGVLSVNVTTGLPSAGLYRICTMNASNSHQPVVMPVAQRGSQDDCIRVNVVPPKSRRN